MLKKVKTYLVKRLYENTFYIYKNVIITILNSKHFDTKYNITTFL